MFAPRGWLKRPSARRMYRTIEQSGLFDRSWYRAQLGPQGYFHDPLWHYLDVGWMQGKDPSSSFDTSQYLASYPDVRMSGLNPLFHYVEHGQVEDRRPVRFLPQAFQHYFPDARALPTFLSESSNQRRISVVIDSETLRRKDLSLQEILQRCVSVAEKKKSSLRVISLLPDPLPVHNALNSLPSSAIPIHGVFETPHAESTHYDIHNDEHFIATSWTSAYALRQVVSPRQLWVLPSLEKPLAPSNRTGKLAPLADDTWRMWALADSPLPATTGDIEQTVPRKVSKNDIHIAVLTGENSSPLHLLLILTEIEHLEILAQQERKTVSISLFGARMDPLSTMGEVLLQRDPKEISDENLELDYAVNLDANESLISGVHQRGVVVLNPTTHLLAHKHGLARALSDALLREGSDR